MNNNWNIINSDDDIKNLLNECYGFHDSILTELTYSTGNYVNEENFMHFSEPEQYELHMIFHSQSSNPIELCFTGVKKYCVTGWQNKYSNDILDCYLKFHKDLITGLDDELIVFADYELFKPKEIQDRKILDEPGTTYVIAKKLKWRFI